MITIFTDGSSRGNPGPGGWGAIVVVNSDMGTGEKVAGKNKTDIIELGGAEKNTTNNRMELMAAIEGLRKVSEGGKVKIYSDSSYVINGITTWIHGWKSNNWKTKTKDDVMNVDLWQQLDDAVTKIGSTNISWEYVGGHIGIAGNERCDEIATAFADGEAPQLYNGPLSEYSIKNILDVSHDAVKLKAKKSSSTTSNAKAYSYVSTVGGKIETHRTWAECEKRVKGTKGARYKKSFDAMDEARIIDEFATL